jgi:two-component system, LytTR family, response regulator
MDHSSLKTLIVDDEPIARKVLREELELLDDVTIVGEAENGEEALRKISALQPDLVFLDLQMPVIGGFDVVRRLTGPDFPQIVIVTAFDSHAIRAFETGAIDYLLKPVSQERLRKAVARATAMKGNGRQVVEKLAELEDQVAPPNSQRQRRIVGKLGDEHYILSLDDVLAFQAEGELVWIVSAKRKLLATQSLRAIDERLQNSCFQRVHRNAIVNVNHVRKISPLSSQRWLLTLSNLQELIVSKRQAKAVRKMLHW